VNPLEPSLSLIVKLGSIVVHADEATSPGAHELDVRAIRAGLADEEVSEWLDKMNALALLPVKR